MDQGKNLSREQLCPVESLSFCRDGSEHGCQPTNLTKVGGEWPKDHPLPLPRWGRPKQPLIFTSVEEYEVLAQVIELNVQHILQAHNYNTFGNFIRFYNEYKKSGETCLMNFYRSYCPPITSEHHTCVGLSLELMKELFVLENRFPGLIEKLYLVSCEESVDDIGSYTSELPDPYDSDKEHVLVALKIDVAGRPGILLLDPGYHIGRAITIMNDCYYPHTGWFVQSEENLCRKEYCYSFDFDNEDYVYWQIKESKPDCPEKMTGNLIYVNVPYLAPVDVTERRNLAYEFKCLVRRTSRGRLTAGVYFPFSKTGAEKFTVFYQDNGVTKREKMAFDIFDNLTSSQESILAMCNSQLGLIDGQLTNMLRFIRNILNDDSFVQQIIEINQNVYNLGQDEE